ncbi:uncharacterized protein LOC134539954 [Bacillus rossius redtenbacheri]|uniref:uncharacterized protein LOC134539954 n=1 Tax=Bacillus rossius redtenbacheri TaxID=93214 RepID=UPI002FDE638E
MQPQVITALVALLLCVASTSGTARRTYGARQHEETDYNDYNHIGVNTHWINCVYKILPGDPQRYYCCPIYPTDGSRAAPRSISPEGCSVKTFPEDDPPKHHCCPTTDVIGSRRHGVVVHLAPQ